MTNTKDKCCERCFDYNSIGEIMCTYPQCECHTTKPQDSIPNTTSDKVTSDIVEEKAQNILDRFFEKGATVKKDDWDFLLATLTQAIETDRQRVLKATVRVVEKHLLYMHNLYSHDIEAHQKGACSYPLTAICMAEEHKWKHGIQELASKTLHDIEIDFTALKDITTIISNKDRV